MGLPGQHNVRLDRVTEILSKDPLEACRDVRLEGVADIKMLAFYGELHWLTVSGGHWGQRIAAWLTISQIICSRPRAREHMEWYARSQAPILTPPFLTSKRFQRKCNARARRRCDEEGIRNDSRYLATVRRAISTPSARRISAIRSSDSTAASGSASIRVRMRVRTASAEWPIPPS